MLQRILRFTMVISFAGTFMVIAGHLSPASAAGESDYVTSVIRTADVSHIFRLIEDALFHSDGLSIHDADLVYDALGRTNTALDALYTSGATGDVFNSAEQLLLIQRDLLQEIEQATLTGDLADLSTVAPLLVNFAQARVVYQRQAFEQDTLHSPFLSSRSFLGSRHFTPDHRFSRLSGSHRSLLSPSFTRQSLSSRHLPGTFLNSHRRSRLLDSHLLDGYRLSRHNRGW